MLVVVIPCSQESVRKNPLYMNHIGYHFFLSLSFFSMVFFSIFKKDYRFGNEFGRFKERSLEKMNKIEPKIKWEGLPLFQS